MELIEMMNIWDYTHPTLLFAAKNQDIVKILKTFLEEQALQSFLEEQPALGRTQPFLRNFRPEIVEAKANNVVLVSFPGNGIDFFSTSDLAFCLTQLKREFTKNSLLIYGFYKGSIGDSILYNYGRESFYDEEQPILKLTKAIAESKQIWN